MKKIILMALVLFVGVSANQVFAQKATKVVCFKSDMDCSDCEKALTDHLRFEKGVKDLKVDHASNTVYMEYKEDKNSDESIAESIEKIGYKAEIITMEQYTELLEHIEEEGHVHEAEVHRERK